MDEEFHKRFSHQLTRSTVGCEHIYEAVEGKQYSHLCYADELVHDALAPEARQSVIPNR